jgi:hypothetical protein
LLTVRAAASFVVLLACSPPPPPTKVDGTPPAKTEAPAPKPAPEQRTAVADDDDEVMTFDAIVRVDAEPGSKKLQGVWLERGDGERWIVAYRAEPWLVPFADKKVSVTGGRYIPGGQAVKATHFRLDALRTTDDGDPGLFESLGAEQEMTGELSERSGTVGAKDEGERYPVFTSDAGNAFELANRPDGLVYGKRVKVRVREMQYSKFAAHRGGPMVWVIAIDGKSTTPAG